MSGRKNKAEGPPYLFRESDDLKKGTETAY